MESETDLSKLTLASIAQLGINVYRLISQSLYVVGGQAPKAIRSVECYDFKEDRWRQVSEMTSRRCRAGVAVFQVRGCFS